MRSGRCSARRPRPLPGSRAGAGSSGRPGSRTARRARASRPPRERALPRCGWRDLWTELRPNLLSLARRSTARSARARLFSHYGRPTGARQPLTTDSFAPCGRNVEALVAAALAAAVTAAVTPAAAVAAVASTATALAAAAVAAPMAAIVPGALDAPPGVGLRVLGRGNRRRRKRLRIVPAAA